MAAGRIDRPAAASYTIAVLVPSARCGKVIKREHGADYPSGAKIGTDSATVSGKLLPDATDRQIGKAVKATVPSVPYRKAFNDQIVTIWA